MSKILNTALLKIRGGGVNVIHKARKQVKEH